jgi:hypothetical protein
LDDPIWADLVWDGPATGGRVEHKARLDADRREVNCWDAWVRAALGLNDHGPGFPQCGGLAVSLVRSRHRVLSIHGAAREVA